MPIYMKQNGSLCPLSFCVKETFSQAYGKLSVVLV
jgi:hypothetical protein